MIELSEFLPGVMDGLEVRPVPCRICRRKPRAVEYKTPIQYEIFCRDWNCPNTDGVTCKTKEQAISDWNELEREG
jgi:hypothetical protein